MTDWKARYTRPKYQVGDEVILKSKLGVETPTQRLFIIYILTNSDKQNLSSEYISADLVCDYRFNKYGQGNYYNFNDIVKKVSEPINFNNDDDDECDYDCDE